MLFKRERVRVTKTYCTVSVPMMKTVRSIRQRNYPLFTSPPSKSSLKSIHLYHITGDYLHVIFTLPHIAAAAAFCVHSQIVRSRAYQSYVGGDDAEDEDGVEGMFLRLGWDWRCVEG